MNNDAWKLAIAFISTSDFQVSQDFQENGGIFFLNFLRIIL